MYYLKEYSLKFMIDLDFLLNDEEYFLLNYKINFFYLKNIRELEILRGFAFGYFKIGKRN